MPFLDFLRNRTQAQQPVAKTSQTPARENAKHMYTREAAQERTSRSPVSGMPEEQKARAMNAAAMLEKASQHIQHDHRAFTEPADAMANQAAMRQNMTGQERTAHGLSPTTWHQGALASDPAPPRTPPKPRTLPRTPPSWER